MSDDGPRLTGLQRAFVDAWFGEARFNGTEAARIAGYSGGDDPEGDPERARNLWRAAGSRTLTNVNVQEEIRRRWAAHGMTAEEVVSRLVEQARVSFDMFLDGQGRLDVAKVRANGHLVKAFYPTKHGMKLELYDGQRALELVGKTMRIFVDRQEVTASFDFDVEEWKRRRAERLAAIDDMDAGECGPADA